MDLFRVWKLPTGNAREHWLKTVLERIVDPNGLKELHKAASNQSPVEVYVEPGLRVLVQGSGEYQANAANACSSPREYINKTVVAALLKKAGANSLGSHRPNIVMVSLLLSNTKTALTMTDVDADEWTKLVSESKLDAIGLSFAGINERLAHGKTYVFGDHLAHTAVLSRTTDDTR